MSLYRTPNPSGRRERSSNLRRNSAKQDKNLLKEEVKQLLSSAGLECAFDASSNGMSRRDLEFLQQHEYNHQSNFKELKGAHQSVEIYKGAPQ